MPTNVHQCPRCELRFFNPAELSEHFSLDHGADPSTFDRYRYAPRSRRPTPEETRRYLVVANQTLTGEHLVEAVCQRADERPSEFFVLVPATHSAAQQTGPDGEPPADEDSADDAGLALARWRLRTVIDRLDKAGIEVEGQIGHPDPIVAVTRLLRDRSFDEILLSTLPEGISRWLSVDLPSRLERRCRLPVTALTAELTRA